MYFLLIVQNRFTLSTLKFILLNKIKTYYQKNIYLPTKNTQIILIILFVETPSLYLQSVQFLREYPKFKHNKIDVKLNLVLKFQLNVLMKLNNRYIIAVSLNC